ncbi:MAG: tRNA lysidine(34) synthetase TilS [Lachnospiraceae bacterium]|nr:tRNA lysidine(34) synthetase TilS [Lachnospiraceae bacterium]
MSRGDFESRVKNYIEEYGMLQKGDRVTVGVSGGADSVCLIFVLLRLRDEYGLSLGVVHVMHGIRGEEAVRDRDFVEAFCKRYDLPFECIEKDVPQIAALNRMSVEEAGRMVRYEAFENAGGDKTAVAHNADDMAETVLFNLFRGSSIRGLSGIAPVSGRIIRPLLGMPRRQIEEYLKENGQEFVTDSTNFDNDYSRNKIRNIILPKAREINLRAADHINETARDLQRTDEFLTGLTRQAFDEYAKREGETVSIDVRAAGNVHEVILKRLIYMAIGELSGARKNVSRVHVEDTIGLFYMQSGRRVSLIYGLYAERCFDKILIRKEEASQFFDGEEHPAVPLSLIIEEGKKMLCAGVTVSAGIIDAKDAKIKDMRYTKWFDYDKMSDGAVFRTKETGDVIAVKDGNKKVKDVLTEEKIPRWKRGSMYMLADGKDVLWIPGIRYSERCRVGSDTRRVLILSWEEEEIGRQD